MRGYIFILLISMISVSWLGAQDTLYTYYSKQENGKSFIYYKMAEYYQMLSLDSSNKYVDKAIQFGIEEDDELNLLKASLLKSFILYNFGEFDASTKLLDSTCRECKESDYGELKILASNYKGRSFLYAGKFDSAIYYFGKVSEYSLLYNDSISYLKATNNIGTVYLSRGLYRSALENYLKALPFAEEYKDPKILATLYANIGTIQQTNSDFENAIAMYKKAEAIAMETNNNSLVAMVQNNMGICYRNLDKPELYLQYAKQTLETYTNLSDINGHAVAMTNLGYAYWYNGQTKKALKYLGIAEKESKEISNLGNLITVYQFKSRILMYEGRIDEAFPIIERGIELSQSQKVLHMETLLTDYLRWYYQLKKDYKRAFKYQQLYQYLNDSLSSKDNKEFMARLTAEYESEKKDKENQLLHVQNELAEKEIRLRKRENHLLIALLTAFVIAVIYISRALYLRISHAKEMKALNNELEKANDTKNKFFSILSHDLRTPFSALLGFSQLSKKELEGKADLNRLKEYNDIMYHSSGKTYDLLNNILEWAKSQLGKIEFKPDKYSLGEALNSTLELLQQQALNKSISLKVDIHENHQIYVDKQMLTLIIRNLVSNAIKFTHEGKEVSIIAYCEPDKCFIEITDQGVGMDQETVNNLFEIDKTNSTKGTNNEAGSGMGLILTKEFMDYHKGEINVESELGKGSKFKLSFPK